MKGLDLLDVKYWKPLAQFGLTHPFFKIDTHLVLHTWIILLLLCIILLPVRWLLKKKLSAARYLITSLINSFIDLNKQTLGTFSFGHFSFITALFIFIFMCSSISLIPWMEEPTRNLNTTFALGIISFIYVQFYAIKTHGIKKYLKEFLDPFFIMLPLNIIGKLATVISISFRLFGNIFGGSIIATIWLNFIKGSIIGELLGLLSGINLVITIFFGLFEGFLQSFVFAMLSLTYLSIATQKEENKKEAT